jgi:sigma-B regulation protein RsbU (phosphoserine phosphatase)
MLVYTNAGHNYPVIIRKDGTIENLQTGGLVIGVEENAEYKENTIELFKGDLLVLYSDGISEAMDKNENLYSETRLIQNIIKYRNHEPAVMINRIIKDVRDFSDGLNQFDDMTMVVCKKL